MKQIVILLYRCLTKPGGRMLLGVPVAHDEVQFNSAKIYGPLQMSHMLANWEQIHADIVLAEDRSRVLVPSSLRNKPIWSHQPGIVVQKKGNKL